MTAVTGPTDAERERVPDALAPPPGHPRFPLFDGLRAIAALLVLLSHTGFLSTFSADNSVGGALTSRANVGVSVFFVISGFLLYRPFVAARFEGRPRPRVPRYFRRRALRIVPAYWLALTVCALVLSEHVRNVFTEDWWIYYGFLQNLSHEYFFGGLVVAWSLCAEVAFYLALPLYVLLAAEVARGHSRRGAVWRELVLLASLAVMSVAARGYLYREDPDTPFPETLPGTMLWFSLGMAMAVLSASGLRPRVVRFVERRPGLIWAGAGAVYAIAAASGWPRGFEVLFSPGERMAEHLLFGAFAALVVAPAVFSTSVRSVPGLVLSHPVVQWLGLISYGIFLWHVPLASWMAPMSDDVPAGFVVYTLAVVAVSSACAAASYYLVERPLLRFK